MTDIETRSGAPVEVRAEADEVRVEGYAAVFDQWANIGGFFEERIAPGAFDGRLGDDVQFLVNHGGLPLARTSSGTLDLRIDERGLYMGADLDRSDPDVAQIVPKLRRGDLSKMSFAFTIARQEWDETGDILRRTILEVGRLVDVAVVNEPAYSGTEIGLRSLAAYRAEAARNSQAERARRMRMGLAMIGKA